MEVLMARPTARRVRPGAVLFAASLFALTGLACSSTGGRAGGNPDLITREQILDQPEQSAFELIERLRPRWLRARSQGSFANPTPEYAVVYVDDMRFGEIASLHRINAAEIDRIEFISGLDATTRFGTGTGGGVIHIRLWRSATN
jgi:hypothetical protein